MDFQNISRNLPPETKEYFRVIWDSLSSIEKSNFQKIILGLPTKNQALQNVIKLSSTQLKTAFGQKNRVSIVGPANVGKSTLFNQFVQRKEDRAEVSPVPGTTHINQQSDAGIFCIIDTPGTDIIGSSGKQEKQQALLAASDSDFLIIVFDAIQGIRQEEIELLNQLIGLNKPYIIVINKIDLVQKKRNEVIQYIAGVLRLDEKQLIPISAISGENFHQVIASIAMNEPAIITALGQAMPQYRWQLAWRTIINTASLAAVIAITPLPVIDFVPLTISQSAMILSIARIYNFKMTIHRARELIITFGIGFIGRSLFYELSKLGGIPGWLLAAAIASSTTVAMGYASIIWFERGKRLSNVTLGKISKDLSERILDSLVSFGKHKPNKKKLQDQIVDILEDTPFLDDNNKYPE